MSARTKAPAPPAPRLPVTPRRAPNGTPLMVSGQPNPTGTGRYCPPKVCYCGGLGPEPLPGACAWWASAPYSAAHVEGSLDWHRASASRARASSGRGWQR